MVKPQAWYIRIKKMRDDRSNCMRCLRVFGSDILCYPPRGDEPAYCNMSMTYIDDYGSMIFVDTIL